MPKFIYPIEVGNRWEYLLSISKELDTENLVEAVSRFFGHDMSHLINDAKNREDYNIVRIVDEVVDVKMIRGRKVFLIHSDSFNARKEVKLARAMAVWREKNTLRHLNLYYPSGLPHAAGKKARKVKKTKPRSFSPEYGTDIRLYKSGELHEVMAQAQDLLPLELGVGTAWKNGRVTGEEDVLLPAGWFHCYVVECAPGFYGEGQALTYYYASGIGLAQLKTPLYTLTLDSFRLRVVANRRI